jgi:putative transcriptional regulator
MIFRLEFIETSGFSTIRDKYFYRHQADTKVDQGNSMSIKRRDSTKLSKRDIGAEIIAGLREIRDRPETLSRTKFGPIDVKAIRETFGMSQSQFAAFLCISARTLQKWEQGRRSPDGAANTLLRVMQKEPEAVMRALHGQF